MCNIAVDDFTINCQQDAEIEVDRCRTESCRLNEVVEEQRPTVWIVHQTRVREQLSEFVENERLLRRYVTTVTITIHRLQHIYINMSANSIQQQTAQVTAENVHFTDHPSQTVLQSRKTAGAKFSINGVSFTLSSLHIKHRQLQHSTVCPLCCDIITHARTHAHLTALYSGLPGWAGTRKVKPICILLKQETASGSGISWPPRSRQITTPAPNHSVFTGLLPNQQCQSTEGKALCYNKNA